MFGIQNYGSFIMAVAAFQIIPGAGTITILNATARHGVSVGMQAVLGTLVGDFIYMLAAVLGLAAILTAYPSILAGAQWIGVAYLCWLGWTLFRSPEANPSSEVVLAPKRWAYFKQALAVSLTNPKVIMFFMAFFPLFISPESRSEALFTMMLHVTGISVLYQSGLVLLGNAVARRLSQWGSLRSLVTRLAGVALIGFGMKFAFNDR